MLRRSAKPNKMGSVEGGCLAPHLQYPAVRSVAAPLSLQKPEFTGVSKLLDVWYITGRWYGLKYDCVLVISFAPGSKMRTSNLVIAAISLGVCQGKL